MSPSRPLCVLAAALALSAPGAAWAEPPALIWPSETRAPGRVAVATSRDAPLYAACGAADAALVEVATRNVARQVEGARLFPSDELAFEVRAAGSPHVWPRGWSIAGASLDEPDIVERVRKWSAGPTTFGALRCGVARARAADGTDVISAVAIDALADMAPLPTVARVGQWLTLEGTMLVPATAVKVVLLGPRGAPKSVVASIAGGRIRSSFSVDQPGAWLVQVLATVSTGPRPVLEAMVFAGVAPPPRFVRAAAPGESAASGAPDDATAMHRMINAARAAEGVPPLPRDAALDSLAADHAREMQKARVVGHDLGDGDPRARLDRAGVRARIAGENVASAGTLEGAHRALWASPSHRSNLLLRDFRRVGVAVLRDEGGAVWVTELFAG